MAPVLGPHLRCRVGKEKNSKRIASLHSVVQGKTPNRVTFQPRVKGDSICLPNKAPCSSSWSLTLGGGDRSQVSGATG